MFFNSVKLNKEYDIPKLFSNLYTSNALFLSFHKQKSRKSIPDFQLFLRTPDENRTHIFGTGIRYSIR